MIIFSILGMKTKWILDFLYKFSIIATCWEHCTITWKILWWLEGITHYSLEVLTCVLTHLRWGWTVISNRRNYLTLPDAVHSSFTIFLSLLFGVETFIWMKLGTAWSETGNQICLISSCMRLLIIAKSPVVLTAPVPKALYVLRGGHTWFGLCFVFCGH